MNKDQYQQLCHFTDEILNESEENSISVAIHWLHIIREHPGFLKDYEDLFDPNVRSHYCLKSWKRSLRNQLSLIKVFLISVIRKNTKQWSINLKQFTKCDVLFISHLLNQKHYENNDDFYFSNLPQKLSREGYNTIMAMLNHSGISPSRYSNVSVGNSSKFVLSDTLGIVSEMKNLFQLFKESRKMKKMAFSEQIPLKKKFFFEHPPRLCLPAACMPYGLQPRLRHLLKKPSLRF